MAGLPGIMDSRNDVLPAGHLRVQCRGRPQDLAAFKVDEMENDGGRPEVAGQAADPFPRSGGLHIEDRPRCAGAEEDGSRLPLFFPDGMGQFPQCRIFAIELPNRPLFTEFAFETPKVASIILQRGQGKIHLHFFDGRGDLERSGNGVFMLFQEAGGENVPYDNVLKLGEADGQLVLHPGQAGEGIALFEEPGREGRRRPGFIFPVHDLNDAFPACPFAAAGGVQREAGGPRCLQESRIRGGFDRDIEREEPDPKSFLVSRDL